MTSDPARQSEILKVQYESVASRPMKEFLVRNPNDFFMKDDEGYSSAHQDDDDGGYDDGEEDDEEASVREQEKQLGQEEGHPVSALEQVQEKEQ